MSINATSGLPIAPVDRASPRESRFDEDRAAAPFAGVFASAMVQHAPPPKPAPKPHDATSELDGADTADDKGTSAADSTDDTSATATPLASADATATPAATATATANATTASTAVALASANAVVRSTSALDPTLQQKLARVMERVQTETGHAVTVTETYRTQTRQDSLFAQGRETPGPVVTWTQSSKHTQGRAVDVVLDGGKAPASAYAALQRIAREEGLNTLGARDPGHLELPGAGTTARTLASAVTGATPDTASADPLNASAQGQVSVARIGQLAQVVDVKLAKPAQVAQVAQVARVATVARPGVPGQPSATQPVGVANVQRGQGQMSQGFAKQFGAGTGKGGTQNGGADQRGYGSEALSAFTTRSSVLGQIGGTGDVATDIGTTGADRTARVIAALQDAPARPLSQITMSVDTASGTPDRVQLSLRGSTLDATIDTSDPRAAHAMSSHSDELVRSLAREGIEVDSLRVRAAASSAPPIANASSQRSSDSSANPRSERGNQWEQQERQRSDSDRRQANQQKRDERGGTTP